MSCHVMSYNVMCYVTNILSCYVMLCHAMSCYVMLCNAMYVSVQYIRLVFKLCTDIMRRNLHPHCTVGGSTDRLIGGRHGRNFRGFGKIRAALGEAFSVFVDDRNLDKQWEVMFSLLFSASFCF